MISDLAEYTVWFTLTANSATLVRYPVPYDGTIREIRTVLQAAITTSDATVTTQIAPVSAAGVAGTPVSITGGAITITQSGSAAGDVDMVKPTGARRVHKGDELIVFGGGGSAQTVNGYFIIDRS